MQWKKQQYLPLDFVHRHTEFNSLSPVVSMVVCHSVSAISKVKIKLKATLENHQEEHYFQVSNNLPTALFIFQGMKQDLDTTLFLFGRHRVSQAKRWIHVPVMKKHSLRLLESALGEEAPFSGVTGDSNCLEQTGHIMAEANPILRGEKV